VLEGAVTTGGACLYMPPHAKTSGGLGAWAGGWNCSGLNWNDSLRFLWAWVGILVLGSSPCRILPE